MRVQIDLKESRVAQIDELVAKTGVGTRKQLFNNALAILEWAIRQREAGRIIGSLDMEGRTIRELEMPALSCVPISETVRVADRAQVMVDTEAQGEGNRPGAVRLKPA